MTRERQYLGKVCTAREHRLKYDAKIQVEDGRLHVCSCGGTLIGNGRVVVRASVIAQRFKEDK